MSEPFTKDDFNSAFWMRLKAHYEEKLARHRVRNDASTLTPEKTARLRGRIAEVKEFLALEEGRPAPSEPDDV